MITINVASGKGGAGKTSFSAALAAALAPDCVYADCDVDAANGAIALGATETIEEPYFAGPGFSIDPAACSGCGRCAAACRFKAIVPTPDGSTYRIVPELCERCGACQDACPSRAVVTAEKQAGRLLSSAGRGGLSLAHAELEPGEDTSGKLVALVRRRAREEAAGLRSVVVDAPPGIGCPVIASLSGCDLLVVIVEASASGIRDAARLVELATGMGRPMIGIVNKAGLDVAIDEKARALLSKAGIDLLAQIRFDPALRSAEESGKTWAELEGRAGDEIRAALDAVIATIRTMEEKP